MKYFLIFVNIPTPDGRNVGATLTIKEELFLNANRLDITIRVVTGQPIYFINQVLEVTEEQFNEYQRDIEIEEQKNLYLSLGIPEEVINKVEAELKKANEQTSNKPKFEA